MKLSLPQKQLRPQTKQEPLAREDQLPLLGSIRSLHGKIMFTHVYYLLQELGSTRCLVAEIFVESPKCFCFQWGLVFGALAERSGWSIMILQ